MKIDYNSQDRILNHLDRARKILSESKSDESGAEFRKQQIREEIDNIFHKVQLLDTRPI